MNQQEAVSQAVLDHIIKLGSDDRQLAIDCLSSFAYFNRLFFKLRTGKDFIVSKPIARESHHDILWRELTNLFHLRKKNLFINIHPGSGKSEICRNFVAWTLAHYPDSNFLYISFSEERAQQNTAIIKDIISLPFYRKLFGVSINPDYNAKGNFKTNYGGVVTAFGSAGSITGADAGLPGLDRFSGGVICFPYDEYVFTDKGKIKIGDIVENKLNVKVYSYNFSKNKVELKPIINFYKNKGSDIVEVKLNDGSSIRCTPDHKIWTLNRGWVSAINLNQLDRLPYFSTSPFSNCMSIYTNNFSNFINFFISIIKNINLFFCEKMIFFRNIFRGIWSYTISKVFPCFAFPYLSNCSSSNTINISDIISHFSIHTANTNIFNNFSIKLSSRSFFRKWECPVSNGILHIFGFSTISKVIKTIISTIPINMSYLKTIRSFSNKCKHHKSMNLEKFKFRRFTKSNSVISFPSIIYRRIKNLSFCLMNSIFKSRIGIVFNNPIFTSYSSKIRNTIKSLIARDRFPLFVNITSHVDNTYCINVEDNHNFFSGLCKGVLVSNCDDLHKPDEVASDVVRGKVINNYVDTISNRLRGENVIMLAIGQRLHEDDIFTYFEENESKYWERIILQTEDSSGNILYPEVNTPEKIAKAKLSEYSWASQHQQNPIPAGGGIFKKDWFPILDEEPEILSTFISADTAETSNTINDPTVFSFWGLYRIKNNDIDSGIYALHWIDCAEIWVEPKDLYGEFMVFYANCMRHKIKPKQAIIEKKSTGATLASVLDDLPGLQVIKLDRNVSSGSKTDRFLAIQSYVAEKRVTFTKGASHVESTIEHMGKITANMSHKRDDRADTCEAAIKMALIDKIVGGSLQHSIQNEIKKTSIQHATSNYTKFLINRHKRLWG